MQEKMMQWMKIEVSIDTLMRWHLEHLITINPSVKSGSALSQTTRQHLAPCLQSWVVLGAATVAEVHVRALKKVHLFNISLTLFDFQFGGKTGIPDPRTELIFYEIDISSYPINAL